ncbi:heptaprenyl diphosphate synthase component 1 [Bacillus sp. FJAT-49732]|uniref:Heptaprenyl diphosphate synthase component 1 n=1 Tax=Lederbergia citrisecunda TaxID=2833583 RepID=A0A942TL92_9BACI|nr:heptaprenyl diphosphate synthase component 1 [Lederbergia citrisecunda]MBS4199508.1 heptaprenyl diphosphate synthase component 1 [Lederbergia citrisecunda]
MAVCNFEQQVDSIKRKLQQTCSHHFLYKHIEPPELDVDQIHLMAYSLRDSSLSAEECEIYIIATMLANLALETHENVSNPNISMKARQLTVLAGDYYSGMYYNLLSELQNIELIKALASAIKTINEHKINIIHFTSENLNSYLNSVKKVESGLLEQFCVHFQTPSKYINFFTEFLFFKRVAKELKWLINGKFSLIMDGLKNLYRQNSTELSLEEEKKILFDILNESKKKLDDMMKDMKFLPSFVHMRIDELAGSLNGGC